MILRLFLKQQKLFLVIVVECVHPILFSIYLFKQMSATFTDHKIYVQKKISLMYSPVCDFSGSSTKCWISAHAWSCGHGYRLCVLCTLGLPVPKCMSGIARVLCLSVPACSHRARLQGLRVCVCFSKLSLLGEVGPELSQVPGGVPVPWFLCQQCHCVPLPVGLCQHRHKLWSCREPGTAGCGLGRQLLHRRVQRAAESSEISRACCASLVASVSHQMALWPWLVATGAVLWATSVLYICPDLGAHLGWGWSLTGLFFAKTSEEKELCKLSCINVSGKPCSDV